MTFRRDLKRRIRERQEKTGERYTTARAHVLATPPAPSWVVELHDVTEQARLAGLTCPVRVTSALQRSGELQTVLEQLRRILLGPVEGVQVMQRVALRGQPDPWHGDGPVVIVAAHAQRFQERLQHGLRGPGPGGRVLAFDADLDGASRTIIAQLLPRHTRDSLLVLSLFRDESAWLFDSPELWTLVAGARP
ncbi:MAG TPA: hypothetical protein VNM90_21515 [Haliangium sp.]|nr:hypothetical protein [Haliangium sp.]